MLNFENIVEMRVSFEKKKSSVRIDVGIEHNHDFQRNFCNFFKIFSLSFNPLFQNKSLIIVSLLFQWDSYFGTWVLSIIMICNFLKYCRSECGEETECARNRCEFTGDNGGWGGGNIGFVAK